MAEPKSTVPPVNQPDEASLTEKKVDYAKKSRIAMFAILGILSVAMVYQTARNMNSKKPVVADKPDAAPRVERKTVNDFAREIDNMSDEQKQARATASHDKERDERIAGIGKQPGAEQETEESILIAHKLNELKAALAGGTGRISRSTGKSMLGGQPTVATDTSQVDTKIAQLQSATSMADQKRQEIFARAAAMGITLPNSPKPEAPILAPSSKPSALSNLSFGVLASNRANAEPNNPGPKQNEELIPTGSVISAITETDMISDYPGHTIAVVQRPFYNIAMDKILLPAGTKITLKNFRVSSVNEAIQNRLAVVPQWAIRPDGKRIDFRKTGGMDSEGVAALQDQVDRHLLAQIFGVGAYAILGLGPSTSNYGAEANSSKDAFVREMTSQARNTGRGFAEKYLNIVPTIRIRSGTPMKIFVEDDIYISAWENVTPQHFQASK